MTEATRQQVIISGVGGAGGVVCDAPSGRSGDKQRAARVYIRNPWNGSKRRDGVITS